MPTVASYAKKTIEVTFRLYGSSFDDSKADVLTVKGLRTSVALVVAGGLNYGNLQLRIYGMTLSTMNRLSTLGMRLNTIRKNTIKVSAGDVGSTLAVIFEGTIYDAWADFDAQPDVGFNVTAVAGLYEAVAPADPSSYNGTVDAAVMMGNLGKIIGLTLENNGVNVKITDHYFHGSTMEQIQDCADTGHFEHFVDMVNRKLCIWPKGQFRESASVPLVAKDTGMVGYPTFNSQGITLRTLFNPSLIFGMKLKVKSVITPAEGDWVIYTLHHNLESERPGGPWFSVVEAAKPGEIVVRG